AAPARAGGTEAVGWREGRTDDWAARGYGERDYGRGAFGSGYGERDYGRGGYGGEGGFGLLPWWRSWAGPASYVRRSPYSAAVRRTKRETDMPEIYVHAVKGRSLDQKRALIKDITDAVVKNFSVPAEAVMVEIVESEPTAKAKGGVLFSEMRR